ncbi:MAG: hypothetical protein K2I42_05720 [Anaeroplasmataceae bacterium]|nr:hypothetical protein [Anaeroplasmataceae bacterium]
MEYTINPHFSINQSLKKMKSGDVLILEDGVYHEKVEIWIPNIKIKSKHPLKAIISNKDYYHKIMEDYNECNTFNTFTVYVGSDYVMLENIIIENKATPSEIYGQAVALHVDGTYFTCYKCIIKSAQDTLFTGPMPKDLLKRYEGFYSVNRLKGNPSKQIYSYCTIEGDVDFIFGSATALFKNCKIISLDRKNLDATYIAAPAHPKELPYGYLFHQCEFKGKNTPAYLARPWRDYGCAAFIDCCMGTHILSIGYNKWNNTDRDKTARFYEYTKNIDLSSRAPWAHILSKEDSEEYLASFLKFIELDKFH